MKMIFEVENKIYILQAVFMILYKDNNNQVYKQKLADIQGSKFKTKFLVI